MELFSCLGGDAAPVPRLLRIGLGLGKGGGQVLILLLSNSGRSEWVWEGEVGLDFADLTPSSP